MSPMINWLTTGFLLFDLAACSGQRTGATFQSSASYDRVYAACLSAVPAVGYSVTSADKADGLIVAQQGVVLGSGSTTSLTASISRDASTRTLRVDFVAPPASLALGGFQDTLADYIAAVRTRVPDIRAAHE